MIRPQRSSPAGEPEPAHTVRWLVLLGAIAAISALHYITQPSYVVLHAAYQRAYYVPVILAAYWYGIAGGLAAALASSLAYAPHIHMAWSHNEPYTVSQYAEFLVFLLLGWSVGFITSRERRLSAQYRAAADSLERTNRELRESQEHLRRAERLSALGEIAAGLAHEIRNPLAGMKGALEIVTARLKGDTPEAEFAGIAASEAQRLEGLLDEFLTYARPHPPRFKEADLDGIIDRAVTLLEPQAEQSGVGLSVDRSSAVAPVWVDPEQIQQVLVNVVLNAIEASPRQTAVEIRRAFDDDWCEIGVTDHGDGISPEARARIFDPFFTTKEGGTGLGLAITQRIIQTHRGHIDVVSPSGGGTTLRIRLPRRPMSQPGKQQQSEATP